jgi:hypothetical protein
MVGLSAGTPPVVPALLVPSLNRWRRAPLRGCRRLDMLSTRRSLNRARGDTWASSPALGRPLAAYVSATRTRPPAPCLTRCASGRLPKGPLAPWCRLLCAGPWARTLQLSSAACWCGASAPAAWGYEPNSHHDFPLLLTPWCGREGWWSGGGSPPPVSGREDV